MATRDELDWMLHLGQELKWISGEMTGTPLVARQRGWTPRMDLLESPDYYLLKVELAGVQPSNISLSYHPEKHSISIRGERSDSLVSEIERCTPHLLEIEYGSFSREIELPEEPIDLSNVKTQYRSGMLYVVLPKASESPVTVVIERTITLIKL